MSARRYKQLPVGIFNERLDGLSLAARGLFVTLFTDERVRPCGVFRLRPGELPEAKEALWKELACVLRTWDRWVWIPEHAVTQGAGPKWTTAVRTTTDEVDGAVWQALGAQSIPEMPYRYPIDTLSIGVPSGTGSVTAAGTAQQQELGAIAPSSPRPGTAIPFDDIVDLYHQRLPGNPRVSKLTDKRRTALKMRWTEDKERQSLDWWERYFTAAAMSPFLVAATKEGFRADIDFLLAPSKMARVVEGFYRSKQRGLREELAEMMGEKTSGADLLMGGSFQIGEDCDGNKD